MFIKKAGVLIFVLILFSLNVFAANLTEAYNWLNTQTPTEVYSASWAVIALKEVSGGSSFIQYLKNQKDSQDCWPKGSCKAKETALAALALSKNGENVDKSLEWLNSKQEISLSGEWLLQIKTEGTGTCDITYTTTSPITKKINVDKGFITSEKCTTPSTFFNLGNCLEQNLLLTKASLAFDIKCSVAGDISSLYRDSGIYYLNDDVSTGSQVNIKINNGNFGSYEDTLLTNWALKELDSKTNSLVYLRKNFNEDAKSNAFLYLLTQKQNYVNDLGNLQKPDKSFGNVFDTAIASLALDDGQHQTQIDQIKEWLDLQQDNKDHSWNKNILDTAVVLYSTYPKDNINLGEQSSLPSSPQEEQDLECNEDNSCDANENSLSCPNDCSCGDNICDSSETTSSCSKDCEETETPSDEEEPLEQEEEEEERSFGFLWFIIIFLILGGLLYFAYKKFGAALLVKSKPKERPSFIMPKVEELKKTEFRGPMNILKPIKNVKSGSSKAEDDLERSLKEARKLLGK